MAIKKSFYIGCRRNPQFDKPYFVKYGQLSKTEAKRKEKSIYGSMTLEPFETEDSYNKEIERLKEAGYNII